MPDLTMTFANPRILDDVSFHPCVRFRRWENERLLSFIPPDGNFRLISYNINSQRFFFNFFSHFPPLLVLLQFPCISDTILC